MLCKHPNLYKELMELQLLYALIGTFCGKSLEILFPMVSGHCSVANRLILTLHRSLK